PRLPVGFLLGTGDVPQDAEPLEQWVQKHQQSLRLVHEHIRQRSEEYSRRRTSVTMNRNNNQSHEEIRHRQREDEQVGGGVELLEGPLTSAPVLAYADFTKPFILEVDARHDGLGAVLSQEQDGKVWLIAFAIRGLRPTEKNMENSSFIKLELLAVMSQPSPALALRREFPIKKPRLPVGFLLGNGVVPQDAEPLEEWVQKHQQSLRLVHEHVRQRSEDCTRRCNQYHTEQVKDRGFKEGQLVYLRNHVPGQNKIQDYWNLCIYRVVRSPAETGVAYLVAPASEEGPIRHVHRVKPREQGPTSPSSQVSEEDLSGDTIILCLGAEPQEVSEPPQSPTSDTLAFQSMHAPL
ncbi:hypothetical protein NFI96_003059, partial [Prochilodus magdalenae]